MTAKPLHPTTPVTASGLVPSLELVQIIQGLVRENAAQAAALEALTARVTALEAP